LIVKALRLRILRPRIVMNHADAGTQCHGAFEQLLRH